MLEFRKSFVVITFLAIALGFAKEFILFLTAVTVHELSHMAVAKYYGLSVKKIIFTPVGEIAVISGIESLGFVKRVLVYAAGPFVNSVIGLVTLYFFPVFAQINLYICLFNLLPVYPLDGGSMFLTTLGSNIGILNASRLLNRVGKALSILMIATGIVQVILYPYNISLLCIGVYLLKNIDKEYLHNVNEMYKSLLKGYERVTEKGTLHTKTLFVSTKLTFLKFIRLLSFDHFFIIHITDGNTILKTVDESEVAGFIMKNGVSGTFADICMDNEKMITN